VPGVSVCAVHDPPTTVPDAVTLFTTWPAAISAAVSVYDDEQLVDAPTAKVAATHVVATPSDDVAVTAVTGSVPGFVMMIG
jgi:hypothetical protein